MNELMIKNILHMEHTKKHTHVWKQLREVLHLIKMI